jgi:hypothetical protein
MVLAAPLHLGQSCRPQEFPVYMVDLVDLCIAQTDVKNGPGPAGFGCFHAHAASTMIEGHGCMIAIEPGAEIGEN